MKIRGSSKSNPTIIMILLLDIVYGSYLFLGMTFDFITNGILSIIIVNNNLKLIQHLQRNIIIKC